VTCGRQIHGRRRCVVRHCTAMRANDLLATITALFCVSCQTDPPRTNPETATSATAVGQTSVTPAAPSVPVVEAPTPVAAASEAPEPAPAPSSSAAKPKESYCVTAAESIEIAKPHQNAPAPYANCAVGIFAHCGGGNGERGHLCSRPLDVKATAASRKTKPNTCCYEFVD
jgi:hypothetical protein